MKAPIGWLKDFTDIEVSPKELADAMTLSGSKVEEIISDNISGVYAAQILSIEDHPDSDHLHILKVDFGTDELGRSVQIVCGAPNVEIGMICPAAAVGAHLPEIDIKKGKIRGVESFGMCCSGEELGALAAGKPGADVYGLWDLRLLPEVPALGTDINDILNSEDLITIDFEITSNRPDCFSIEGLGREAAVTLGKPFKPVSSTVKQEGSLVTEDIAKVDIEAPDLCYRYCSRIVEDVTIGPSPSWMAERLTAAGMRPINNIVDITNYVCLELGQPMHAFDLDYLSGNHIIVRTAKENEPVKTLDGNDHVLNPSNLVIADEEKICAIAGVMGGENSEVLDTTKCILFESATFNGVSVRKTAISNGLRTEASSRYEKGLDPENALRALDRACELVEMLGCGKVSKGLIDVYPTKRDVKHIEFRPAKINQFIGINADEAFMRKVLADLGCEIVKEGEKDMIIPPTYRPDLESEADISEEIARFYGYNNIEATLLSGKETTLGGRTKAQKLTEKIRDTLVSCGFCEAITYSFESPADLDLLKVSDDSALRNQVKISNPLGDDTGVMRTTMLPSMLRIAARNYNRGVSAAKVFEVAYVYIPDSDPECLPEERKTLCGFGFDTSRDSAETFYELKGIIEEVARVLGIRSIAFEPLKDDPSFHPGRTAEIKVNNRRVGVLGVIHPDVAENFEAPAKSCFFEISVDPLIDASKSSRTYKQLPKFPGIMRDLAFTVASDIPVGDMLRTISSSGGKYLKDVELFDVYQNEKLGDNIKSVAVSLEFRAEDRTLADADIKDGIEGIISKLDKTYSAKLRQ
ncbi:MAG: phenylalanine--tRNA ligase subunit beta [Clostridiales bacterium]|nr:phenylalanine--tRNA ligase subunit beta [Clostridiales bacterium]